MEHPGGVTGLTPGVTAWTAESIASLPPGERRTMAALVDEAGVLSARAQALPTAITSTVREEKSSFFSEERRVLSFPATTLRFRSVVAADRARRTRTDADRTTTELSNTRHTKRAKNAVHVELTCIFLFPFHY
jgi:hypothetical protein